MKKRDDQTTISLSPQLKKDVKKMAVDLNTSMSAVIEDLLSGWMSQHTSTNAGTQSLNPEAVVDTFAKLTASERGVLETVLEILRSKDPDAMNSAKFIKGRVQEFNLLVKDSDASKTANKKQGSKPAKTGTDS